MAKDNINFSATDLVGGFEVSSGAGWTVTAMFAQTSGLPYLLPIEGGTYGNFADFAPGAVCLRDILKEHGYSQEIMVGSDLTFGGRRNYFEQHGNYKVFDYYTAIEKGKIEKDYYVWWGYEDVKLFEYAKEELEVLSKQKEPFNFTMLTVDTHHVGGYLCSECGNDHLEQYENVLSCSSRQVKAFVDWVQQQEFYENTTIIIVGDHLTMDEEYVNKYYIGENRYVYNCIINSACDSTNTKNRHFNTFDMFPTTLSAMGVEIEGDMLGLGTNLFSEKQTLSERYGLGYLNEEFGKKSVFYREQILGEY